MTATVYIETRCGYDFRRWGFGARRWMFKWPVAAAVLAMVLVVLPATFSEGAEGPPPAVPQPQQAPAGPALRAPEPPDPDRVEITAVSLKGTIEGENITFALEFTAECKKKNYPIPLITGDLVLDSVEKPQDDYRLRYSPGIRTYFMSFRKTGTYQVAATFAARPVEVEGGPWRESAFRIPSSRMRQLEVTCDRTDLEILFPGALRVDRAVEDEKLTITALLGPDRPFEVRWKPQVAKLDAKLVLTCEANTIASARAGALRLDTLFALDISQGTLTELAFSVPKSLSITQVRGQYIRDWRIEEGGRQAPAGEEGAGEPADAGEAGDAPSAEGDAQTLRVILNRPQTDLYGLQVLAEMALPKFPAQIELPVMAPLGGIRSSGHLAIGTDSAIHLVVQKTSGLSQVDASAFAVIMLDRDHPRPVPRGKGFYYTYASLPYQMSVSFDDIVPSFDASERLVINVLEDDLTIDVDVDLDVRDAPIRSLVAEVPAEFAVADVSGSEVKKDDYTVRAVEGNETLQEVEVNFSQPVLGRTLIRMRLELGRGPLGKEQRIEGLSIRGAKNERGYLVVVAEEGVRLDTPVQQDLREVHTGSVPMRVANAQYAYRFRQKGWSLNLLAERMPAGIRVESFHLVSLGEGVLYGSVVVNYFISGAPVDELYFRVRDDLSIEFVSRDVSRWTKEGELCTVKLQRKIIGDYNLAVTYTQRYEDGKAILIGGVECDRVETQAGYIAVASHLNVNLTEGESPDDALLEINRDEIPANYRLMVNAPILKTYKFVDAPHRLSLVVKAYERGSLLPAVVEAMELRTDVGIREDGEAESVTRIRYKIKNSTAQFLTLTMPRDARVWTAHVVDGSGEAERRVRVTASLDEEKDLLMIPLRRYRDPNEPTTVELEYGQPHEQLGWRGLLKLVAPRSVVHSTFAAWHVTVQKDWAIEPDLDNEGNMVAEERNVARPDLALLVDDVLSRWKWTVAEGISPPAAFFAAVGTLVIVVVVFFLRRRALAQLIPLIVLGALLWAGITAIGAPGAEYTAISDEVARTITFSQVLNAEADSALVLCAAAVPAWRRGVTLVYLVLLPLVAVACFAGAVMRRRQRRLRAVLAALGFAVLICTGARIPFFASFLIHLFTWIVPALIILWFVIFVALRRPPLEVSVARAAALILPLILLVTGCTPDKVALPVRDDLVMERAECVLTAEEDSMAITLKLDLEAKEEMRVPLLTSSAILLSPERAAEGVDIELKGGRYYAKVEEKGKHQIELKFLSPLPKAGDDQVRIFRMPMPWALTNRVQLTIPDAGMQIEMPSAIRLTRQEDETSTVARAILGPGDEAVFMWKPRARRTELELTSYFTEMTSVMRFDSGLVEGRHRIHFQIAQGELKEIRVAVPENMTVTSVEGEGLGTWRFDPAKHLLEARLSQPAKDTYVLSVATQISANTLPYDAAISSLTVEGALSQRGTLGLMTTSSVHISITEHPQAMNVDDFTRDAAALLATVPGYEAGGIRHAYRVQRKDAVVMAQVHEVKPEIRARENAVFTVADDRLIYNGELAVEIAKAGLFSVDLTIPSGYDIDTLTAPEVSHWDETASGYVRTVQVHFRGRMMGAVTMKLTLSRPVAELPAEITVPRVEIAGALKHTGQMIVSSDRGVRLSLARRNGVSELNTLDLAVRTDGGLAFKLLKPDWEVVVQTEVLKPRVNVEFLHVARATEGVVHHAHYLRYRLENAGSKVFEFEVPRETVGRPVVTGPDIARTEEMEPGSGRWRVELAHKWFDQPFPLKIDYGTQFDRAAGTVSVLPAKARGADLQRGYVVVYATERIELLPVAVGPSLQRYEARSIERKFGADDLSDAPFCYAAPGPDWELSFKATRHSAAELLEAEVLNAMISSVVNELGESINRVQMELRVGAKRHLETRLPPGAEVWSLLVNRGSTVPSRKDSADGEVILIPLAQAASGELPVNVDLVYMLPRPTDWRLEEQAFAGPQFDLPLKDLKWNLYLPEEFEYDDFGGTLTPNEDMIGQRLVYRYNIGAYESEVQRARDEDLRKALALQSKGSKLAEQGRQYEAKQALESAYNYSFSDAALNEDTRVQLRDLNRQQAVVGLVGRRNKLRLGGPQPAPQAEQVVPDLGDQFNQKDAERLESSLSKDDYGNLKGIAERMIEMQEAAAGAAVHIAISTPLRGRLVEFFRPLQVKPRAEMEVSFQAERKAPPRSGKNWAYWAGLLVVTFFVLSAGPWVRRKCIVRPAPPRGPAGDERPGPESGDGGRPDQGGGAEEEESEPLPEEDDAGDRRPFTADEERGEAAEPEDWRSEFAPGPGTEEEEEEEGSRGEPA